MISLSEFQIQLAKTVKGQPEAIKTVTTSLYKYLLKLHARDKGIYFKGASSLLLYGDTGCGKTFIIKQAAEILDIPFVEINAKSITQEGWSGKSFLELFKKDETYAIIFIDEFDKLCIPIASSKHDDVNYHIQTSLLKYIEGFSNNTLDFNRCIFVFAGAFVGLEEDNKIMGFLNHVPDKQNTIERFIKFGMLPEIAGRIQEYQRLNTITDDIYHEILDNQEFCSQQWSSMLNHLDISLIVNKEQVIQDSRISNLGVRGLIQAIETQVTNTINDNIHEIDLEKLSPLYTPKASR